MADRTTSHQQRDQRGAVTRHMAQQLKQLQLQQQLAALTSDELQAKQATAAAAAAAASSSSTAFFSSALCEDGHRVPSHPESWERAQVVRERIETQFPAIHRVQSITPATRQRLLLFHTPKHVDKMTRLFGRFRTDGDSGGAPVAESGSTELTQNEEDGEREQSEAKKEQQTPTAEELHQIDEDTAVTRGTESAALTAAGAVCDAIDLVMRGSGDSKEGEQANVVIKNAFCGVRPPGHHAEPHRAMGFCLFNNVGVGACYLLDAFPDEIRRVAILDFDVHHGNGTQTKFISDEHAYPDVQYISTHQAPFYPNTGKAGERGVHDNILNVPLPARTGSDAYRKAFEARVLPAMDAFRPDFVLISAGFDAHAQDPLAELSLESEDYYWITQQVVALAWKHAQGRVVSVLEGGYNLDALAESAAAHVRALVEGSVPPDQRLNSDEHAIDELASAFASSVAVVADESKELRVTVHCDGKEKLLVLKTRSLDALLAQCKNKFNLKSNKAKKSSKALHDCHGALITSDMLLSLANDQHVYLR